MAEITPQQRKELHAYMSEETDKIKKRYSNEIKYDKQLLSHDLMCVLSEQQKISDLLSRVFSRQNFPSRKIPKYSVGSLQRMFRNMDDLYLEVRTRLLRIASTPLPEHLLPAADQDLENPENTDPRPSTEESTPVPAFPVEPSLPTLESLPVAPHLGWADEAMDEEGVVMLLVHKWKSGRGPVSMVKRGSVLPPDLNALPMLNVRLISRDEYDVFKLQFENLLTSAGISKEADVRNFFLGVHDLYIATVGVGNCIPSLKRLTTVPIPSSRDFVFEAKKYIQLLLKLVDRMCVLWKSSRRDLTVDRSPFKRGQLGNLYLQHFRCKYQHLSHITDEEITTTISRFIKKRNLNFNRISTNLELPFAIQGFPDFIALIEFFASRLFQKSILDDSVVYRLPVLEPHLHAEMYHSEANILNYRPPSEIPVSESLPNAPIHEGEDSIDSTHDDPGDHELTSDSPPPGDPPPSQLPESAPMIPDPRLRLGSEYIGQMLLIPHGFDEGLISDVKKKVSHLSKKKQEEAFVMSRQCLESFLGHTAAFVKACNSGKFNGHQKLAELSTGARALDLGSLDEKIEEILRTGLDPDLLPQRLWSKVLYTPLVNWCQEVSGLSSVHLKSWLKEREAVPPYGEEVSVSPLTSHDFLMASLTVIAQIADTTTAKLMEAVLSPPLSEREKEETLTLLTTSMLAEPLDCEHIELILDDPELFEEDRGALMDELLQQLNEHIPLECTKRSRGHIREFVKIFFIDHLSALPSKSVPEISPSPISEVDALISQLRCLSTPEEVLSISRRINTLELTPIQTASFTEALKERFSMFTRPPLAS